MRLGQEPRGPGSYQRAYTFRTISLMRAKRRGRGASQLHRNLTQALHPINMKGNPGLSTYSRGFSSRLNDTGLVIHAHQGDQSRLRAQAALQRGRISASVCQHRELLDFKTFLR